MPRRNVVLRSAVAVAVALVGPAVARAADYAGTYTGDMKGQPSSVELTHVVGTYTGTIHLGATPLPCRAREEGDHLAGTFTSGGQNFDFTATLAGDTLTLATAGTTYTLTRPPTNPLDAAAPAPVTAAVDATPLARTATGRAVFFHWPTAKSAAEALEATAPLLPKLVGGPTTVTGAFADAKTKTRGGASFTGTNADGKPIRGTILCGGNGADTGQATTVLYATVEAPAADWAALRAALPQPPLKLHTFEFPDGTGTVDLPEGWSTKATSLDFGFTANGPDDQSVGWGQCLAVQSPDSQLIQMIRRTELQARQMGMQPPPRPPLLIAPFTAPPDALPTLIQQVDPMARQNLGFGLRFDRLIESKDAPASLAGGRGAQMSYTFFKIGPNGERKLRAVALAESDPIMGGSWMYGSTEMSAPDETFDAAAPAMLAILKSVQPNPQVMTQHQRARTAQQQQQFDDQQKAHREQMASFDRYNQAWRDRETATSRSNDDFCEVIRGYRTVTDTATGENHTADLTEAQGVADALNRQAGDPNRFVPIPLRDELHPLHP